MQKVGSTSGSFPVTWSAALQGTDVCDTNVQKARLFLNKKLITIQKFLKIVYKKRKSPLTVSNV